jgi:succinoglycan biosynthesis transport protein ExoP
MDLLRSPGNDRGDSLLAMRPAPPAPRYIDATTYKPEEDLPAQYWAQLWRIKWMVAGCAAAGLALGLVIAALQTPIYRAKTSLELQSPNQNYLDMPSINPVAQNENLETFLQTQIQLLGSQSLLERTVQKVQAANPPVVTAPQPFGWRIGRVAREPRRESTEDAAWQIASRLSVKGSGLTRLVDIVCESPHPGLAADFANTLASEYIEQSLENRWASTKRTGEWLTQKVQELKSKLQTAEENLQAYSRSAGLVYTSDKDDVTMEALRRLEAELSAAHMDRVKKQSRFEQAVNSPPDSMPDVMENSEFQQTRAKLVDLRRELAEALTTMKPEHPKVQKLQAQITALTTDLGGSRDNVIRRIRNEFEEAQRRERMLWEADNAQRRTLSDQMSKETRYNLLKRDVESTRMMYDSMMQKLKEVGVAGAMPISNIRVVDPARVPRQPALPSKSLNAALGLVFGALAGMVLGFVRLHSDRFVKTPGEAGALLSLPELGAVPALSSDPTKPATGIRKWITSGSETSSRPDMSLLQNGSADDAGKRKRNGAVDLALVFRDNSVMAEAYRAALPAILFANEQGTLRTLVVTSANPREGKTSSISNLAIGLADLRTRVLLIDGDVRNPRLHEVFGVANEAGLADLLERPHPDDRRGPIPSGVDGLSLLPAGKASPHTKNLLYSSRMSELLRAFEAQYDIILIDTAPALHMRDARLLGSLADAVLLIVRAGRTSREAASAVVTKFRQDGTPVLGVILNDWKPVSGDAVYGSEYLKGYRHYYGQQ